MSWFFKRPKVLGQTAFIKMGQETAIMIYGKRLGKVGDKVQVTFTSKTGVVWTPSPAMGTVEADGWVLVHATPKDGGGPKSSSGSGELSTTVTNSSGTSSPQSQTVYYCP